MKLEDYPNLLIVKKLTSPIELSLNKLQEISNHTDDIKSDVLAHGLFVMAISSLEVMLSDVLLYFLKSFPKKIPSNEFKFEKGIFFDNYFNLLKKASEFHINNLSYKSFEDFFKKALEHFSINWPDFFETNGDYIKEFRATRNLLLHNNLVVNDQYLEAAGPKLREDQTGRKLKVDIPYLKDTIAILMEFETQLKERLNVKYGEYTKINANKQLWKFMFKSPVMPYDDFWKYDEKADSIYALTKGKYENNLSNSETLLLSLWRAHFNGTGKHMARFNMVHFGSSYQEKVLFFLSIAAEFEFE